MRQLNPYARQVQMNDIRESEVIVTLIPEDGPPTLLAELTGIAYAPVTSTRTINVGGQSGYSYQKVTMSGVQVTLTYQVGSDGSRWRRMWIDEQNGMGEIFTLKFESKDFQSPAIGREASTLEYCNITDLQGAMNMSASGGGSRTATVTIHGMSENLLEMFNNLRLESQV